MRTNQRRAAGTVFVALLGVAGLGGIGPCGPRPCPTGEVCSALTPYGVTFVTASLPRTGCLGAALAIGGTLALTAGAAPMLPPFTAIASSTIFSIASPTPMGVTLRGQSTGDAFLRLVDPMNGQLFDRYPVNVRPIAGVRIRPMCVYSPRADRGTADGVLVVSRNATVRFDVAPFASGAPVFSPCARDLELLVDETLSIQAPPSPAATVTQPAWNELVVVGQQPGSASVTLRTGGGFARSVTITVVDPPDAMRIDVFSRTLSGERTAVPSAPILNIPPGETREICPVLLRGGTEAAGEGPSFVWAGMGQGSVCAGHGFGGGCFWPARGVGDNLLIVHMGGFTQVLTLRYLP